MNKKTDQELIRDTKSLFEVSYRPTTDIVNAFIELSKRGYAIDITPTIYKECGNG